MANTMLTQGAPLPQSADHGDLMDRIYRWQRPIYDATRKYFLFGRDRLIDGLRLPNGGSVLEVGCGTGRNLALIGKIWPKARLYGFDISPVMLEAAQARLLLRAHLAVGDACDFDATTALGRPHFDRVVMSFTLSMIPNWQAALAQGIALLAPAGELHIVDFGAGAGLPRPLHAALNAWLRSFHVSPRLDLAACAKALAGDQALVETSDGPMGYYQRIVIRRNRQG